MRAPKKKDAAASVAIFADEATGALEYRSHANTPFDIKLSTYSTRFRMQRALW